MARTSLTVHPDDNVTTLMDSRPEDRLTDEGLALREPVPFGHKVARRAIAAGEAVIKYGVPIGTAIHDIQPGDHVHVHNCR